MSSREVLSQAARVMASARATDERLRRANRQLLARLPGPSPTPTGGRLAAADETSPELALCFEVARVLPFDRVSVSVLAAGVPVAPLTGSDPGLVLFSDQQYSVQEGPEVEAVGTGRPVLVPDLETERARWPYLAAHGRWAPFRALAAFPVSSPGTGAVAVLTVARDLPSAFAARDELVLSRLADLLMGVLLTRTPPDPHPGGEPPVDAESVPFLRSDAVSIAVGVLRQRHAVPVAEIVSRLRAAAFVTGRTVHELATDVVRGGFDPLDDTDGE